MSEREFSEVANLADAPPALVGPDREAALAALGAHRPSEADLHFAHRQARQPAMSASALLDQAARALHAIANGHDGAEAARRGREAVRAWDAASDAVNTLRDLYPEAR
jgi:hypothetical protein